MTDIKEEIKEKFGDLEKIEAIRDEWQEKQLIETKYPKSANRKYLLYENFGMSIEESYFWVKDMLHEMGFTDTIKIIDTFTASEQSAFFGSGQQRLGLQQDKAANYLGIIGKMTKEMFQIVREIKLNEEKHTLYQKAAAGDDGAEKALKGMWIDFIDNGPGGVKASSVYGLATQIGYTVLPDLFFSAPANLQQDEVHKYIFGKDGKGGLDFNDKVKTVLERKLEQFVAWRDATAKEIAARQKFTIQYLRQHYNSIMLYVDWVKPYLMNIKRMGMDPENQMSTDLVGAFEGSVIDIEYIAKKPGKPDEPKPCVLVTMRFRTRPIVQTGQDYQRGPVHIGRMELTLRAYGWTDKQIYDYVAIRKEQDFELLKSIDSSIEHSMDFLGDDLKKYLRQSGELFGKEEAIERLTQTLLDTGAINEKDEEKKKIKAKEKAESLLKNVKGDERSKIEQLATMLFDTKAAPTMDTARKEARKILKEEPKKPSPFEPFTSIGAGFKELAKGFISGKNAVEEKKKKEKEEKKKEEKASGEASTAVLMVHTFYKKSHKLVTP